MVGSNCANHLVWYLAWYRHMTPLGFEAVFKILGSIQRSVCFFPPASFLMLKLKYDKIGKSYKNINHLGLLNIHRNGWLWFRCCITCISSYRTGAFRGNQEPNRLLVWSRFLQVDAWFGDQRQTQTEWRQVRPLLQLCVHTSHIYESNIRIIFGLVLVIRMNQLIRAQEIWWRSICALNPYFIINAKNP